MEPFFNNNNCVFSPPPLSQTEKPRFTREASARACTCTPPRASPRSPGTPSPRRPRPRGTRRPPAWRPPSAPLRSRPPRPRPRPHPRPARLLARSQGKRLVFLLSDGQLKDEAWLEDVNCLLNAGEVPNLFPPDERMQARHGARRRRARRERARSRVLGGRGAGGGRGA